MRRSALDSRQFLSRRALLRGAGVTLALPLLESLAPRALRAQAAANPVRLLYWFIPNGIIYDRWIPKAAGPLDMAAVPESLQPLATAGVLGDVNILSGVDNLCGYPEKAGDHATGTAAVLTCAPAKRVVEGVELGISVDQVAAATLGPRTPRPSLELGMAKSGGTGDCDSGYACTYTQSLSWSDKTTPRPKHTDPKEAWLWLLGTNDASLTGEQRERMRRGDKSVLDYLLAEANGLSPKLTSEDRVKLEQYLTSVRTVEKQLDSAVASGACQMATPPTNSDDYITRLGAMMDVMEFAFRCDLTRVVTFGFGNAFGPGPMPWIGVGDDYHALTHRMGDEGVREQVAKCILWEVEQIAAFLVRLKAVPDGNQNLLYNTAMFVSSDVGEGGPHNHDNIACLVAGNAGGAIASGRHLAYTPEDDNARSLAKRRTAADRAAAIAIPNTNRLSNVHLSLLQAAGVPATSFADSTLPIPGLLG
ncbi:MAG TPA: DUF1552 domain-containing protein [Polyangiaceae bacterium]|nr:DUF1552 domain-containing protein [Polyangiaceae bacterium]